MPVTVTTVVDNCSECPHHHATTAMTPDPWDRGTDYWCKLTPETPRREPGQAAVPYKLALGFIERASELKGRIPEWCPLRPKEPK